MSDPTRLLDHKRRILQRQVDFPDKEFGFIDNPVLPTSAGGVNTNPLDRIYALLTGWHQFESTVLRQYQWRQATFNINGAAEILPDGLSAISGIMATVELYDSQVIGTPTIDPAILTSPEDQEFLSGEINTETGKLSVEIGWSVSGAIGVKVYAGTAAPENWNDSTAYDLGYTEYLTGDSTTMDLPADGSTFYIILWAKENSTDVQAVRYAVSIDEFDGEVTLHIEQMNAVAEKQQAPAICPADDSVNPSVLVELRSSTMPVDGGEPGETRPIWLFHAPITGFWGITQEDTFGDNRYTIAKAKVSNDPPNAMTLAVLTGDDAVSVTATNTAEAESGTHNLPVGSYVYVEPERGDGDVIHYVIRSGGVGGAIGDSLYVRYVHDVDWDNVDCELTVTYKWNEYVKYVQNDGTWYYLFKQTHDTDPTGT